MKTLEEKLERINVTLEKISDKMPESDHPFIRGMVVVGIAVSMLGILQAIDIIVNWLGG